YSHRRLHDLAGAVEKLPDFLPDATQPEAQSQVLRATGTGESCPYLAGVSEGERPRLRESDSDSPVCQSKESGSNSKGEGRLRRSDGPWGSSDCGKKNCAAEATSGSASWR